MGIIYLTAGWFLKLISEISKVILILKTQSQKLNKRFLIFYIDGKEIRIQFKPNSLACELAKLCLRISFGKVLKKHKCSKKCADFLQQIRIHPITGRSIVNPTIYYWTESAKKWRAMAIWKIVHWQKIFRAKIKWRASNQCTTFYRQHITIILSHKMKVYEFKRILFGQQFSNYLKYYLLSSISNCGSAGNGLILS